jgi:hypothetical protein
LPAYASQVGKEHPCPESLNRRLAGRSCCATASKTRFSKWLPSTQVYLIWYEISKHTPQGCTVVSLVSDGSPCWAQQPSCLFPNPSSASALIRRTCQLPLLALLHSLLWLSTPLSPQQGLDERWLGIHHLRAHLLGQTCF